MGFLSNILNLVGVVLLAHAVYSAHEHSLLPSTANNRYIHTSHRPTSHLPSSSSSTTNILSYILPTIDLPLDITLETLLSVLMICAGVVLGSPDLKPIQWRVWAGKLEREKVPERQRDELGPMGNPYLALEQRTGFLDIRASRREFAGWVKEGSRVDG